MFKHKEMKLKIINIFFILLFLNNCVGTASQGVFGTGVSVALDPRSVGTQIDDNIMQKNLTARLLVKEKHIILIRLLQGKRRTSLLRSLPYLILYKNIINN